MVDKKDRTEAQQKADFEASIDRMSFEQKVRALVSEGGYTRDEAVELLEEMGEGE